MKLAAKVCLIALCFFWPAASIVPIVGIGLRPVFGLLALPVVWYVLFTLPEERAQEYDIIRRLSMGPESGTR